MRLLSASRTTGSICSTPSTRSSRFSFPVQRVNASLELAVVAELRQPLAELRGELVVDGEPLVARRRAEDLVVERVDAAQLLDRPLVVLDAQLDDDVGQARVAAVALDDEERRGLLAAAVSACRLGRGEAVDQAHGERLARASPRTSRRARRRSPARRGCCPAPRSRRRCARRPSPCTPAPVYVARPSLARRRRRAAAGRGPRPRPSAGRRPPGRRAPRAAARARSARSAGSRTPASRSLRPAARPTARPSRRTRNFDCTETPHCSASRSQATIEYVATIGLAICRSIRSMSSSSLRRHEHAGYFRAGQRRQHLLGRVRADDDGRPLARAPCAAPRRRARRARAARPGTRSRPRPRAEAPAGASRRTSAASNARPSLPAASRRSRRPAAPARAAGRASRRGAGTCRSGTGRTSARRGTRVRQPPRVGSIV